MKTRIVGTRTKAQLNSQQRDMARAVFGETLSKQIIDQTELKDISQTLSQLKNKLTEQVETLEKSVQQLDSRLTQFELERGYLNFTGKFFPKNGKSDATLGAKYFTGATGNDSGLAGKLFGGAK